MAAGRIIALSGIIQGITAYSLPLAIEVPNPLALITGSTLIAGFVFSIGYVNQLSLRQRITDQRMLGRVTAARRFVMFGMAPIGAGLGGTIGSSAGLQPALIVGAAIVCLGVAIMWVSPIRAAT